MSPSCVPNETLGLQLYANLRNFTVMIGLSGGVCRMVGGEYGGFVEESAAREDARRERPIWRVSGLTAASAQSYSVDAIG